MSEPAPPDQTPFDRLVAIMARLRDPQRGCEWDTAQTFETIAPYTIEEAYEVADAIRRGDMTELKDELGEETCQQVLNSFTLANVACDFQQPVRKRAKVLATRLQAHRVSCSALSSDLSSACFRLIQARRRLLPQRLA